MYKTLLVEDHSDTRAWLSEIIVQVFPKTSVLESATQKRAIQLIDEHDFELAILDINLPDGDGITVLKHLTSRQPKCYPVMATIYDDDDHLFDSLTEGAKGYLLKEESGEAISQRLSAIAEGQPPLSPA